MFSTLVFSKGSSVTEAVFPLATSTWDQKEYDALQEVIDSGRFTMGPKVRQYEELFAEHFGSKYAVMVNSGSSANLLLIAAAIYHPEVKLKAGDEVIVPAVSWATTYYPLQQYGLIPRLVDVSIDTLVLDVDAVETAITPKTRAIFAVNLLGNSNDFSRLQNLCDKYDLVLLEDNCESMGATFEGKPLGTFGLGGTYSSFFSHHISTMEGGMVVTDDDRLYQMMLSMRAHGWTRELAEHNLVFDKTGDEFEDSFRFVLPGYNLRPLEMSGALGIKQLEKLPGIVKGRRENALYFKEVFSGLENVTIQQEIGTSSWFGFSLILTGLLKGRRPEVVKALAEAGVETRPIVAGNFAKNPVMQFMNAEINEPLTNADTIHQDGLFLGNHHYDCREGINLAYTIIKKIA